MTAKKRSPLVPRLRFPESEGAPDWEQKEIGALARVTQGGTPDTSNANYWCGPINWLTPAEMGKEDCPYIGSTRRTLTEKGLEHCSSELLPPRSVIISTRAPIGHLAINTVPMAINQGCRGLIPVADAHFLYYALLHAKPRLLDLGAGNTFKELSGSALKAFVLPTPSPPEQQKIADCLTSLDDLIAAEGRRLEALRRHKQGLMQQLFPRPGETVPRLRFPEFRDAPGWITRPLRELYDFGPTNTLPRDRLNYNIGTVKNIHYGDIHTRFPALFDITREVVPFVTSADAVDDWDPASFCSEGDMIFADASEDVTDVGKSIEIIALDGQRVVSGTHTIFAKRRGDEPLIGFGGHLFRSEYVRAQIRREAQGTKVYAISPGRLADIDVCLPPFSAEQQKIADCLTSLDDLIAAESRRLEALRRHKQGLLQQLFPAPEGGSP